MVSAFIARGRCAEAPRMAMRSPRSWSRRVWVRLDQADHYGCQLRSRTVTHRSLAGESGVRSAFPFPFSVPYSSFSAVFLPRCVEC
jgi:hypothetical protein